MDRRTKHGTIFACIALLLTSGLVTTAQARPRSYKGGSLNLKKVFCPATYKNPRNVAIAAGFLALFRFLGKEPNQDRLTVKKAMKDFHPKKALKYPLHILSCVDDLLLGYPGARKNTPFVVVNEKAINPYQPYGLLGTTWSHIAGTAERLKGLKNFREILLYWKQALAVDFA